MMRPEAFPLRQKRHNAEHSEQHDHRIKTCPLPVTATEMQPHSELIEGERHAKSVNQRADALLRIVQSSKQQHARYCRQRKDSVVEMMHMRSAHIQKQNRHSAA